MLNGCSLPTTTPHVTGDGSGKTRGAKQTARFSDQGQALSVRETSRVFTVSLFAH